MTRGRREGEREKEKEKREKGKQKKKIERRKSGDKGGKERGNEKGGKERGKKEDIRHYAVYAAASIACVSARVVIGLIANFNCMTDERTNRRMDQPTV